MSGKLNPKITKDFLRTIKNQKSIVKKIGGIKIKVCPDVFPPQSNFSRSSKLLHTIFGDLSGKIVLDIGTGTGIQAIQAIKSGAKKVIASDISDKAVSCANYNVKLNNLEKKITVVKSDLFKKIPRKKFDVIIANLPIVDYPTETIVGLSLYDPGLKIHKRLFKEVGDYMKNNAVLIFCHADLQSKEDFFILEELIKKYNFKIVKKIDKRSLGYNWRFYLIKK
jgi:release factor glutamine methyltransferase